MVDFLCALFVLEEDAEAQTRGVHVCGWLAGWVGGSLGWWVAGVGGCGRDAAKIVSVLGEKCREHSLAILTAVKFLCQKKSPDYPPCNFTVIGEGMEKEKIRGGWRGAEGVWVARLKERRNGG